MTEQQEYVAARAALIDALEALSDHRDNVILAGAQAIYLRTDPDAIPAVAPFTTDADLVIDPRDLRDTPGSQPDTVTSSPDSSA